MSPQRILFVGGLHRSGTSLVFQCLREHPQVSGFRDTGVPEDEGQHLQTVYPSAARLGGAGLFGFASEARLTETSPMATEENRRKLWCEWRPYWDLSKPLLLEKTPTNLTKTRFLQALFPDSCFLMLVRHPVAVAYATQRWTHTSLYSLIEHWLRCYESFEEDRPKLARVWLLRYEDFVADPDGCLRRLYHALGLRDHPPTLRIRGNLNDQYFQRWEAARNRRWTRRYFQRLTACFERRLESFGYSLERLDAAARAAVPLVAQGDLVGRAACSVHRGAGWLNHLVFTGFQAARRSGRTQLGLPATTRRSAIR